MNSTQAYLRAIIVAPCLLFVLLIFGPMFGAPLVGLLGLAFAFVFIVAIYGAISSLHKRVLDLESRQAGPDARAATEEK